jgi:hypothetical protein
MSRLGKGRARWALLVLATVLALGALASSEAGAAKSEWAIEGQTMAELKAKEEAILGTGKSASILVPGLESTITCLEGKLSGKIFEGGTDEFTTSLSKCEVVKRPTCKVTEPISVKAKTELLQTGGYYYFKLLAASGGSPLATITITGKECPLPESSKLEGTAVAEVPLEDAVDQSFKFSEEITKKVNESLKAEKEPEIALTFGKQAAKVSGEFVPPRMIAPMPRWRRIAPTKLCTEKVPRCPPEATLPAGTAIETSNLSKSKFVYKIGEPLFEPICNVSNLDGTITAETGAPLPGSFTALSFMECGGGACPVTAIVTPWRVSFEATGNGNGTLEMRGPSFKIVCGGKTCRYGASRMTFKALGGNAMAPPIFESGPQALTKLEASDAECAITGKWEGVIEVSGIIRYQFEAPTTFYLTE